MAEIILTDGSSCLVDDDDYTWLSQHGWYMSHTGYARTCMDDTFVQMHRLILEAKPGQVVDHINRNKLDNRRSNLRFADKRINSLNRGLRKDNKTGVKGVRLNSAGKYCPYTFHQGKQIYWGSYPILDEAVAVRKQKMSELHPDMPADYF